MGFLIFAFRKLSLVRKINQDQYRQMTLSLQQQQITDQINALEQSQANKQDIAQQLVSNVNSVFNKTFQCKLDGLSANVDQATKNYGTAYQKAVDKYGKDPNAASEIASDNDVVTAKTNMDKANDTYRSQQMGLMTEYNAFQTAQGEMSKNMNSIFAAQDKAKLDQLKRIDTRLTVEMKSLESQLTLEKQDLENVEKAETEEAKSAAPKFGLS